uniref:Uncharacterized protein n=1 Tax=Anguilla anguilla TaxID=7936 RepID=A0A0E9VIG8_ANGAN
MHRLYKHPCRIISTVKTQQRSDTPEQIGETERPLVFSRRGVGGRFLSITSEIQTQSLS